ncbi:MAG: hypothetical protein SOT34_06770, partial [Candidatus Borkfalkiaceae bacterium]|nr:hypothetical protein [Christensenellaceae bacterium]
MRSLKRYLLCLATAVFALSLTAGLAVTAGAEGEADPAFTALKSQIESATEGTVKEIRIDGDLTVSEMLTFKAGMSYVIYAEKDVTVTLGENMTSSPMFAVPEDGKVSVRFGKSTDDAGTITFDGNKNAFAERTGVGFLTVGEASSAG